MIPHLAEEDRPPATLTIEEYYAQVWRPDCDFVDGRTEERNVGTFPHATLVSILSLMLSDKQTPYRFLPLPSLRIRVSPTRVRIPDVCLIERSSPSEQVLTYPPLAVFEVLEEEDLASATLGKLDDFWRFGVVHIWVIDPATRRVWAVDGAGLHLVQTGALTVPGTPIRVLLSEMFDELDR
jgi:Uma2 family endonuclease